MEGGKQGHDCWTKSAPGTLEKLDIFILVPSCWDSKMVLRGAAVPTGIVLISTKLAELLGVSNGEQVGKLQHEK